MTEDDRDREFNYPTPETIACSRLCGRRLKDGDVCAALLALVRGSTYQRVVVGTPTSEMRTCTTKETQ